MPRKPTGWSPSTHRLLRGVNWSIGRSRDALVALRGRHGVRVEEIRLVDRSKTRKLDWASNIVVIKLKGNFHTDAESQCLYRLCRAWWQRRTQINDLGAHAYFDVAARDDGRYSVSLCLRGADVQHANSAVAGSLPLSVTNPSEWEDAGLRLLDVAVAALAGESVDAVSIHLEYLTKAHRPT